MLIKLSINYDAHASLFAHYECSIIFSSKNVYFYILFLVSLPSISHKEQLTIFERQNLIKQSQVESDNAEIHVTSDESEARDDNSDSDNEVDIVEPIKEKNLNFDDEFDKIASYKFRKLSEESADEVDHEIAEILSGKLVDTKLKVEEIISETKDTDKENIDEKLENILSEQQQTETSVNVDSNPIESIKNDEELHVETTQDQTILQSDELPNETIAEHKADYLETSFVEPELKETIINGVKNNETLINEEQLAAQLISDENKPPVPIQTYLWEDLKKSREQVSGADVCNPFPRQTMHHLCLYIDLHHTFYVLLFN